MIALHDRWPTVWAVAAILLATAVADRAAETDSAGQQQKYRREGEEMTGAHAAKSLKPVAVDDSYRNGRSTVSEEDRRARDLWQLTNRTRAEEGLPELRWDDSLADAAEAHAKDMAIDGYFSHQSHDRRDGRLVATRSARERIQSFNPAGCAENIAQGQEKPEHVIKAWMASGGHRANILAVDHATCGTGWYQGYWVQVFGR